MEKVDIESELEGLFEPEDKALNLNNQERKSIQWDIDVSNSDSRRWIEFRAGQSLDAEALATLFSVANDTQADCQNQDSQEDGSLVANSYCASLEMRIANGLGDEQTPPALHVIIAEICFERPGAVNTVNREICGAAITTIDWNPQISTRYLRVEDIAVDETKVPEKNLLLRRLILSLSALALKTACGGVLIQAGVSKQLRERPNGADQPSQA